MLRLLRHFSVRLLARTFAAAAGNQDSDPEENFCSEAARLGFPSLTVAHLRAVDEHRVENRVLPADLRAWSEEKLGENFSVRNTVNRSFTCLDHVGTFFGGCREG